MLGRRISVFLDYDLKADKRDPFRTLSGFFALWCGAASPDQAAACRRQLKLFEHKFGLTNTEKIAWRHRHWDYPNGWPPLQYIVCVGLKNYGFYDDAERIAKKFLDLNLKISESSGALWEKYDVIRGHIGKRGRCPTQSGFAWTSSVFLRFLHDKSLADKHKLY